MSGEAKLGREAPGWSKPSDKQKRDFPNFAEYESKTDRVIPVVVLDPA